MWWSPAYIHTKKMVIWPHQPVYRCIRLIHISKRGGSYRKSMPSRWLFCRTNKHECSCPDMSLHCGKFGRGSIQYRWMFHHENHPSASSPAIHRSVVNSIPSRGASQAPPSHTLSNPPHAPRCKPHARAQYPQPHRPFDLYKSTPTSSPSPQRICAHRESNPGPQLFHHRKATVMGS
jgi:hypothetical protein